MEVLAVEFLSSLEQSSLGEAVRLTPNLYPVLAIAGLNIILFHRGVYRSVTKWDLHTPPPLRARMAALVSAVSWVGVVFAGRFLAY
ncbi:hypothetical protein IB277_21380 [Ensifer sp. ENS07]|uniref:hypothetical protein n=1 Tax=Ensifer sp. ENS07 TaxID=2769274 RepID=UPI00177B195B|nr:hypothetical protein [Ensifer sp. ENS07]MBD9638845.1 hypothetical protein [Ensifer sp. ENS07]